jgi:hypothetical protein
LLKYQLEGLVVQLRHQSASKLVLFTIFPIVYKLHIRQLKKCLQDVEVVGTEKINMAASLCNNVWGVRGQLLRVVDTVGCEVEGPTLPISKLLNITSPQVDLGWVQPVWTMCTVLSAEPK